MKSARILKALFLLSVMTGCGTAPQSSLKSEESAWRSSHLRASDGTKINLDYTPIQRIVNDSSTILRASTEAAWLNVERHGLKAGDQARAVIVTIRIDELGVEWQQKVDSVDLQLAAPGRMTVELPELTIFTSDGSSYFEYRQEIAVVINGVWLVDPISGSHNFKTELSRF